MDCLSAMMKACRNSSKIQQTGCTQGLNQSEDKESLLIAGFYMRIEEMVQSSDQPVINIGRLCSTLRWEKLPAFIKDARHSAASLSFSKTQ